MLTILQSMRPGRSIELDNNDGETMRVERRAAGFYGDNGKFDWSADNAEQAAAKLTGWGYVTLARD